MKILILIALVLLPLSAFAQKNPIDKALSRFTDPDNPDYAAFLAEGGKATGGSAKMDRFSIARNIDATGIQVGYVRYILPKKK